MNNQNTSEQQHIQQIAEAFVTGVVGPVDDGFGEFDYKTASSTTPPRLANFVVSLPEDAQPLRPLAAASHFSKEGSFLSAAAKAVGAAPAAVAKMPARLSQGAAVAFEASTGGQWSKSLARGLPKGYRQSADPSLADINPYRPPLSRAAGDSALGLRGEADLHPKNWTTLAKPGRYKSMTYTPEEAMIDNWRAERKLVVRDPEQIRAIREIASHINRARLVKDLATTSGQMTAAVGAAGAVGGGVGIASRLLQLLSDRLLSSPSTDESSTNGSPPVGRAGAKSPRTNASGQVIKEGSLEKLIENIKFHSPTPRLLDTAVGAGLGGLTGAAVAYGRNAMRGDDEDKDDESDEEAGQTRVRVTTIIRGDNVVTIRP